MFKSNLSSTDRATRAILGAAMIAVFFLYPGLVDYKWASLIIGLVLLFTAIMSYCPIRRIFGSSSNKKAAS